MERSRFWCFSYLIYRNFTESIFYAKGNELSCMLTADQASVLFAFLLRTLSIGPFSAIAIVHIYSMSIH
jgi:hypothetical protein